MQNEPLNELTWKRLWQEPGLRNRFVLMIILLPAAAYCFSLFLRWVENREGVVLDDPLLSLYEPVDISMLTFAFTYFPVLAGVLYAARSPYLLMHAASAYAILLLLRMASLYAVPLDPPADIIPLRDPLLELTVYEGRANLKDLFFSGHTATHFMFFLLVKQKAVKIFFLVSAVSVGALVLAQHVHYTVDVLAAPLFAWLAVKLSRNIVKKSKA